MAPRLRTFLPAVCALGLTLAACSAGNSLPVNSSGSGAASASISNPSAVVIMKFVSFEPARVTIRVGQTVEWKWEDPPIIYNVVFNHFSSPTATTGTYFHTFDTTGTFTYRSTLHAAMTGTVVVRP